MKPKHLISISRCISYTRRRINLSSELKPISAGNREELESIASEWYSLADGVHILRGSEISNLLHRTLRNLPLMSAADSLSVSVFFHEAREAFDAAVSDQVLLHTFEEALLRSENVYLSCLSLSDLMNLYEELLMISVALPLFISKRDVALAALIRRIKGGEEIPNSVLVEKLLDMCTGHLDGELLTVLSKTTLARIESLRQSRIIKLTDESSMRAARELLALQAAYDRTSLEASPQLVEAIRRFICRLMVSGRSECVRVMVRCRPLSSSEISGVISVDESLRTITVSKPGDESAPEKEFGFDEVFGPSATQESIYRAAASEVIEKVIQGFNGTIFAYGQTGSGKTYTMTGSLENPGIIPRAFSEIFSRIEKESDETKFLIQVGFLELYNEEIRDLLGGSKNVHLHDKPDGSVGMKGLNWTVVKTEQEMGYLFAKGTKNRSVGATLMNSESSRSHSIFMVVVESSNLAGHVKVGKLNFVDLAGSERQSKTGAVGDTLKEAAKINLSLSALGNVISALVEGSKSGFVPYRDSKLTRLLQDSLGGNTKTVMISNIGPAWSNYDETLSTLRFSSRAKKIKNKPRINEDPKDALIRSFQEEIDRLKQQLACVPGSSTDAQDPELRRQLADMETKLVQGHHAVETELAATRAELEQKAKSEAQVRQQLAEQAEERQILEDRFVTQIDQVGELKKKLEKVIAKYNRTKDDLRDIQLEFQEEREVLLSTIRELQKMVKLNEFIIHTLVPDEEIEKIERRCWFDDETNSWSIQSPSGSDGEPEHIHNFIPDPEPMYDLYVKKPTWKSKHELFSEIQKSVYLKLDSEGLPTRTEDQSRIPPEEVTHPESDASSRKSRHESLPSRRDVTTGPAFMQNSPIPKARGLIKPEIS